ncbi:2-hydroxyacid dehydrogenase [Alteromonas sp. BL110]|uniref:2-hydroxyacid dehydrogenase n=1 Tax=Alteromonas sp. BL110 TaxID=1714845 RepID=UPI000E5166A5|nr:2-hydroxyacid dehydrogenase [Alteromonas sp. BL110]AXT40385.1 2-hydroxyacid dehydrogenase [Alteromonas sp. BL110]RKM79617.1 2-hydroxyacid dehydrogenase [Alteromonas sp. BL110]
MQNRNIAFFSTRPYEQVVFSQLLDDYNSANSQSVKGTFFAHPLNPSTAISCKGFSDVVVFVNDDVNATTIKVLKDCGVKHIALRCAGYNNVDVGAAAEADIAVSRVPAYSPETVAEHTLAIILTLNRKTHKAYNRVREGNFNLDGLMGFTLHGKTVGVIGTGKIGKAVIRILLGFGCKVLCFDPSQDDDVIALGAQYVTLNELLEKSIIVTLHCPLNEKSYHIINADSIAKMPAGVMLINTSRGGLVDDTAIIKGLKSKQIGYLGLDVYERESELFFSDHSQEIIQDDIFQRLTTFPNVLITGHQGFFSYEALNEIAGTTLENILAGDNTL